MGRDKRKPYRIIGAYDSETTNINDASGIYAFPILHQLGIIDCDIGDLTADNVERHTDIKLYRHCIDLYSALDAIAAQTYDYVPVICCHNLSFDMYGLSSYLDGCNVRVLAKSCRKPITFSVLDDDGKPRLVLWDTLVFSGQSLSRMGIDCGYAKAVGEWDYDLIRTSATELSSDEIDYACKDIYALLAWLGWWIRRNPDIQPDSLGVRVVTKTGVVRERRRVRFEHLKGKQLKYELGHYWHILNEVQAPKDDEELYTMFASTRGGFTFCASNHASHVYDLQDTDMRVYGFDAASMHPSCMVSHYYPIGFHRTTKRTLDNVLHIIEKMRLGDLLKHWAKPFNSAVYACYEFTNIRPKAGSLYAKHGIFPLASARFGAHDWELDEDNQDAQEFNAQSEYRDTAINPRFLFGKLESADKCIVYLTELALWEVTQAYDYDDARAIKGYITGRFVRPTDMSVISVMQFYKAKNLYKAARAEYYSQGRISAETGSDLKSVGIPESIVSAMETGELSDPDVESTYMALKSDLNSLYGIECSNEYRRDTVLTSSGIEYEGEFGVCNKPEHPKAWYQFGQRIVGWSRIVQHACMQSVDGVALDIINGDTDSVKILASVNAEPDILQALEPLHRAIDRAKAHICKRAKRNYPDFYDDLAKIGHYECEFIADRFYASWNKAYLIQDKKHGFDITLAGIPAKRGLNQLADRLYNNGMPFDEICNRILGYNVTISYDLIRLHARKFPEWGETVYKRVTDYKGDTAQVAECAALALYPMAKTLNNTANVENHANCIKALDNNPGINTDELIIAESGFIWL